MNLFETNSPSLYLFFDDLGFDVGLRFEIYSPLLFNNHCAFSATISKNKCIFMVTIIHGLLKYIFSFSLLSKIDALVPEDQQENIFMFGAGSQRKNVFDWILMISDTPHFITAMRKITFIFILSSVDISHVIYPDVCVPVCVCFWTFQPALWFWFSIYSRKLEITFECFKL